jgi:hypothetical protein
MDFCLGSEADRPIDLREEMFVPFYLAQHLANATVSSPDGVGSRPLVARTVQLLPPRPVYVHATAFTPLNVFWGLCLLVLLSTALGLLFRRPLWGIDAVLFALYGIAGCVVAFLVFFSEHPAVSPNFLLLLFHPIHLIALPFIVRDERRRKACFYHYANAIVVIVMLLAWTTLSQVFDAAIVPLALCLLIRSCGYITLNFLPRR